MKIKTSSGAIRVNKRSRYARFLAGYQSTGAFDGAQTLAAARENWRAFSAAYPSVSAYDGGRIIGALFKTGADEALMLRLCPESKNHD